MLDDFLCARGPWAEQLWSKVSATASQFNCQVPKRTPERTLLTHS